MSFFPKIFRRHLLLGGLLILAAACGKKEDEEAKKEGGGEQAGPTPVKLVAAQEQQAIYYDEYPARVAALNIVELRTQVPGFVTAIYFKEGEVVKKGQPLYEIDRRKYLAAVREARAGVQSAQAQLENARVNLGRYERLAQQDAIARQVLDNATTTQATAEAQVAVARAALATAQTDLDYSLVKAPFTGRIGISQVRLGAQVSAGSTLLNTISSEDPMGVDFVVNEQELSRFQALQGEQKGGLAAQDSTLRLTLPGGKVYAKRGRIRAVDRGVNTETGTVQVRMQFDNPARELKDGLTVVLRVLNEQSGRRVVVPNKAILDQMGESFVFVVRDTVALQRKVELGPRLRDDIVILKGLKAGEKIVAEGLQQLRDSATVTTGRPKPPQEGKKSAGVNWKNSPPFIRTQPLWAALSGAPHPRPYRVRPLSPGEVSHGRADVARTFSPRVARFQTVHARTKSPRYTSSGAPLLGRGVVPGRAGDEVSYSRCLTLFLASTRRV